MKNRVVYITINDYDYPMVFSMATINLVKKNDGLLDMLYAMIQSGCEYMNAYHLNPADKNLKISPNGKILPISYRELAFETIPTQGFLKEVSDKISECTMVGKDKEIEAVVKSNSKKKVKR